MKSFVNTEEVWEKWNQMLFDSDYQTKELQFFEPMVREIFTRQPFDPTILQGQA